MVPDMLDMPEDVRHQVLSYRKDSEQYTEKMAVIMEAYFVQAYPEHEAVSRFITAHECIRMGRGQLTKKDFDVLYARLQGCFMLNGVVRPMQSLDAILAEHDLELEQELIPSIAEVRGVIACKGKVTGTVKKIVGFKDAPRFELGNILVTEMTNPDYLPIVKMARGVVTDEGGMASHASITCRELKIPCIVGTKIATRVFQNGDQVEVDADTGVVKLIRR